MRKSQILEHFFAEHHGQWKTRAKLVFQSLCKEQGIHPKQDGLVSKTKDSPSPDGHISERKEDSSETEILGH